MTQESHIDPSPARGESLGNGSHAKPSRMHWRQAIMTLIASRFAIIELESKELTKETIRRISMVLFTCFFALFAWALFLVSGISLVSDFTRLPWNEIALGAAIIHLLGALIFSRLAKPTQPTSFPVTRSEFKKDREWIENFEKAQK